MIAGWTPSSWIVPATPAPIPKNKPVSLVKRYLPNYDRVLYTCGFKPPAVPRFRATTEEEEASVR